MGVGVESVSRRWRGDRGRALGRGPWRGCCTLKPLQTPGPLQRLSQQSGAGIKQSGVGDWANQTPCPQSPVSISVLGVREGLRGGGWGCWVRGWVQAPSG